MKTLAFLLALAVTSTGFSQLVSNQPQPASDQVAVQAEDLTVIPYEQLTDEHKKIIKTYEDSIKEKTYPVVTDKLKEYVKANPRLAPYFLEASIKAYPRYVVGFYRTTVALVPTQRPTLQTVAVTQVPSSRYDIFSSPVQPQFIAEPVDVTIVSPSS